LDTLVVAVRDSIRPAIDVLDRDVPLAGAEVEFASEDPAIARVNARGEIVGVRRGITQVRVRLQSAAAGPGAPDTLLPVRVVIGMMAPVRQADTIIALGETRAFEDFLPRFLSPAGDQLGADETAGAVARLVLVSGGSAVRFVPSGTFLIAQANGTDTVRATVDTSSVLLAVTVRQRAASVAIVPDQHLFVALAESLALGVNAVDRRGNGIASPSVVWRTGNSTVAAVAGSGRAEAVANGSTTIVASVDDVADTIAVSVDQRAAQIEVEPASAAVAAGAIQSFQATAYDANGFVVPDSIFAWRSLNSELANRRFFPALGATGTFEVAASGQATIAAQMDGTEGYALVTAVQPGLSPPSSWGTDVSGTALQLRGTWGVGPTSILLVGFEGTILQQSGTSWARVPVSIAENLVAIWGASASEVYVAGNLAAPVGGQGRLYRFDGASWLPVSLPSLDRLFAVWGAAPNAIFAAGENGRILQYDGSSWSVMSTPLTGSPLPIFRGIWGTSAQDVWAVGGRGTILHYDGTAWSSVASGTTETLQGVFGMSATSVYAAGTNGVLLRWNGTAWAPMTIPPVHATRDLWSVWGSSETDLYAVGSSVALHWDGLAWTDLDLGFSPGALSTVWGTGAADVLMVGDLGVVLRGRR
jgi:hypothetical protein